MMKYMIIKVSIVGLILALAFGFMGGCASVKPYEYTNEADGMMPGPGLISGQKGHMTIFHVSEKSKDQPDESQASDASKETPKHE